LCGILRIRICTTFIVGGGGGLAIGEKLVQMFKIGLQFFKGGVFFLDLLFVLFGGEAQFGLEG